MSGFVASPPSTPPDPENPGLDAVAGDGFFPAVSLSGFRDSMRLGTLITDTRARDALRGAMATVRRDLRAWKKAWTDSGAVGFGDIDADQIDGINALELLYRRAVFAFAAADLAETHNDISATADGKERTEERTLSADEHRRNGLHAIRDIKGTGRTTVELI